MVAKPTIKQSPDQEALIGQVEEVVVEHGIRRACRDSGAASHPSLIGFLDGEHDMGTRRLNAILRATGYALRVVPIREARAPMRRYGEKRGTIAGEGRR